MPPSSLDPIRIVPLLEAVEARAVAAPAFTYRGGPLLGSVDVVTVFVGPAWADPGLAELAQQLDGFFAFVVISPLLDQLGEYSVPGISIGHGSHGASVTLPDAKLDVNVSDDELRSILQDAVGAGTLPSPGQNTLYSMFLAPGVTVELGGSRSCQTFCGYHDAIGDRMFYAVLPHPDCSGCGGNMRTLDALTVTASHELAEAVTDPVPGTGWYDDTNGEIGDVCAWETKTLGEYTVQLEWSNRAGTCV